MNGALARLEELPLLERARRGAIRLVFELAYPEWETPGLEVTETSASPSTRTATSTGSRALPGAGAGPVTWATGIRKAEGVVPRVDRERGIVSTWEHLTRYGENGWLGCGVILDPAAIVDSREEAGSQLVVVRTPEGAPATWYAGSGWDRSGRFPDAAAWDRYLDAFAARLRSPLKVEVAR